MLVDQRVSPKLRSGSSTVPLVSPSGFRAIHRASGRMTLSQCTARRPWSASDNLRWDTEHKKNSIFQENHGKTMQNHWKTIGGKTYRKTMRQLCKICPWTMNSPTIHSRTCESPAIVPPSSRRSRCTSRAQERAGIAQVLDASLGSSSCPVTWRFQLCFTMVYSMFYSVTSWWQNWYLRNHELNASSPNKLNKIGKATVFVSISFRSEDLFELGHRVLKPQHFSMILYIKV